MLIVAHADDMELSAGGTCMKYLDKGYDFHVVYSTNNMSGGFSGLDENGKVVSRSVLPAEEMKIRKAEAARAAELFHTVPVHLDYSQRHYFTDEKGSKVDLDYGVPFPEGLKKEKPSIITAHENKEEVSKLAKLILQADPEVIITLGPVDTNPEHVCTGYLAAKARKEAMKAGYDGTMIFCTTPAPLRIAPMYDRFDTFIDTSGYMQRKQEAVGCHASQKPRPEILDYRDWEVGARCECETAEAFIIADRAKYKTGQLTAELLKNHIYCMENYRKFYYV